MPLLFFLLVIGFQPNVSVVSIHFEAQYLFRLLAISTVAAMCQRSLGLFSILQRKKSTNSDQITELFILDYVQIEASILKILNSFYISIFIPSL